MRSLFAFAALLAFTSAGPVPDSDNTLESVLLYTLAPELIPDVKVDETHIIYWFFSNQNPTNGIPVTRESLSALKQTSFSTARDTLFVVHGWQNTNNSSFITTVRQAIIDNLDANIFVVDWSTIAAQDYIPSRYSVADVGRFLGQFIADLVSSYDLQLSRTTLVGHSLGGHVVGNAGASLRGEVSVIVGLDPALPLFIGSSVEDRLDASDAKFVQVIHTNGGFKGYLSPLGHSDYYPNGGLRQPGCGTDAMGSCAHARAYEYYAESLGSNGFVGVSCGSYLEYSNGLCSSRETSVMGTANIDKRASGVYYLNTNDSSPYALG